MKWFLPAECADLALGFRDFGAQGRDVRDVVQDLGTLAWLTGCQLKSRGTARWISARIVSRAAGTTSAGMFVRHARTPQPMSRPTACVRHEGDVAPREREVREVARLGERGLVGGLAPDEDRDMLCGDGLHRSAPGSAGVHNVVPALHVSSPLSAASSRAFRAS